MKRILIGAMAAILAAGAQNNEAERQLKAAINAELVNGDLKVAIKQYGEIVAKYKNDRAVTAMALVHIAECYQKMGDAESRKIYEQVVKDYADQKEAVTLARARLGGSTAAHEAGIATRRVWADAIDTEGAPSPDGRHLTFVDWTTGDLAIRDLTTGSNRRLTSKGSWGESSAFALYSSFSPDGKQVVYAWLDKEGVPWELRIVSTADGPGIPKPRILYRSDDLQYLQPAQWSPDGKHILTLFTRKDRTNQIALVSVADGSARVLKTFDWRAPTKMSFSPDGRYIAYDFPPKEDFSERDIYVMAADGSREFTAVEHPANDLGPVWTPDGKNILFISDRTGTQAAWIVPVTDGKTQGPPEPVKTDIGNTSFMGFTRGGALFYAKGTGGFDIYVATLDLASGKVLEPPKKIPERVEGSNLLPDWSPDGRYLAYIRGIGGDGAGVSKTVCIWTVESKEERELRPKVGYLGGLRWSPDSRSLLAWGSDRKGRKGAYQIDAQNGEVTPVVLAQPGGDIRFPQWSSDYKLLFYLQSAEGSSRLMVQERETGTEKELLRSERPGINAIRLSPDNRQIALLINDPARKSWVLKVMAASGGEPRELAADVMPQTVEWVPAAQAVIFGRGDRRSASGTELWWISASGGTAEKLGLAALAKRNLRIHPDGRRIAFYDGVITAEIWVMENFVSNLKPNK